MNNPIDNVHVFSLEEYKSLWCGSDAADAASVAEAASIERRGCETGELKLPEKEELCYLGNRIVLHVI